MNLICVCCNDLFRWNIIAQNMPSNISNFNLVVVTDTRLGDKVEAIEAMTPYATVITALEVLGAYEDYVGECVNANKYPLGYKMILPWYILSTFKPTKFIMLDDDIVLTEKLDVLFENCGVCAMHRFGYDTIADNNARSTNLKKLSFDVCNIKHSERIKHVNGGHLMFTNEIDTEEYLDIVDAFFMDDICTDVVNAQKNWKSFYIDEVFFTALYHYYSKKYENVYCLQKYIKCHQIIPEKTNLSSLGNLISKYAITHFAFTNKKLAYNSLIELGYLKTGSDYPCY